MHSLTGVILWKISGDNRLTIHQLDERRQFDINHWCDFDQRQSDCGNALRPREPVVVHIDPGSVSDRRSRGS